ncbi:unnamed protein product [Zymoseptoria tritici ST99CH_1E4]|uniref:Reverse transcriptase Ty1/copia-type domain-containing protein n=1 Tax=Zymoseptoria tritici ST99CH_1E4 TaxID=1276532 RepID=A0A2H1GXC8_ZYMTR|nr:unnamed protein product [Zymoseptoria tritici ST99CH_1E4]
MLGTRPNLSFAVLMASRFCSNPSPQHHEHVKRIMRYILGTLDAGLEYSGQDDNLVGYSDAEYAGDRSDSKSIGGYVFTISSTAVSWRCKKQTTVALSTAEAEYTAVHYAVKEAVWLKEMMAYFGYPKDLILIRVDNQSAIKIANNPEMHKKTKHIRVQFHYTRDQVDAGYVNFLHIPGDQNPADIFTKVLGQTLFEKHALAMGMVGIREGRTKKELLRTGADEALVRAFLGYLTDRKKS